MRSYEVARKIFSFLEFIGWSVVVIGIIAGFVMAASAGNYADEAAKIMLFLTGASFSLVGLFFVGAVQSWRASVDSAEYGQQKLKIAREQLEISRQGLRSSAGPVRTFAAAVEQTGMKEDTSAYSSPSASVWRALPQNDIHENETITHNGTEITRRNAMYITDAGSFDSLALARKSIDQKALR